RRLPHGAGHHDHSLPQQRGLGGISLAPRRHRQGPPGEYLLRGEQHADRVVPAQLVLFVGGDAEPPAAPRPAQAALHPAAAGRDSTAPPPRWRRPRRMARPTAQSTTMARNAAKIQAASSASALLIPGPAAGARQDWSPAARSTAREYLTSRGSASPGGCCPASDSASSSRARAVATSTREPSSAWRTRIETRSSATERKPLLTAARPSPRSSPWRSSPSRILTRLASARTPTTGGCPVRMPISPSRVLAITIRAVPDQISPSGATSATRTLMPPARRSL